MHICKLIFVLCHVVTQKYRNYLNTSAVAGLLFSSTHLNDFGILFKDDFHVVPNSWVRDIMKCLRRVGLMV